MSTYLDQLLEYVKKTNLINRLVFSATFNALLLKEYIAEIEKTKYQIKFVFTKTQNFNHFYGYPVIIREDHEFVNMSYTDNQVFGYLELQENNKDVFSRILIVSGDTVDDTLAFNRQIFSKNDSILENLQNRINEQNEQILQLMEEKEQFIKKLQIKDELWHFGLNEGLTQHQIINISKRCEELGHFQQSSYSLFKGVFTIICFNCKFISTTYGNGID